MFTLLTTPALQEMTELIRYQMEEAELTDNGWWDIFCQDCDRHEVSLGGNVLYKGESLEHFAERKLTGGWIVNDLKRGKSLCPDCGSKTPEVTEDEEREDFKVYEQRKAERE
jgi:Zn finger protein HypA/HybF involved in hydrogenase expression